MIWNNLYFPNEEGPTRWTTAVIILSCSVSPIFYWYFVFHADLPTTMFRQIAQFVEPLWAGMACLIENDPPVWRLWLQLQWLQFMMVIITSDGDILLCWLYPGEESMLPIYVKCLTHWGRMTHICVSELSILGSDNGLSPGRRQAII